MVTENILYSVEYFPSKNESKSITLSIHRTSEGAAKYVEKHKKMLKRESNKCIKELKSRGEDTSGYKSEDKHEIFEVELKD